MTDLATVTSSSATRLSNVVRRLESRALVRRQADPLDGRGTVAALTDDGWATVSTAAPAHVAQVRTLVFDELSAGQVRSMCTALAAILSRLDPAGTTRPAGA